MFFVEWWNSMGTAAQIFACLAIPSTLVLLIQTVMMLIGIGNEGDGIDGADGMEGADDVELPESDGVFGDGESDVPADLEGLDGLRVFTVRGIVAFLVVFGWTGVAMLDAGIDLWITLPVALIAGIAVMIGMAFLFRAVMKLRSDGNADNRNAIGISGKVHLTIPPARSGSGKVHIMLQGSYVERDAVTDEGEAITTGSEIVVVAVSGQTDLVVKKK